ncbi:MAG: FCD domain-containing protein, partial [Spirochaetota bacterium]
MSLEIVQGLYFLSNTPDPEPEAASLRKKLQYVYDPLNVWVANFLDHFERERVFPVFEVFTAPAKDYLDSIGITEQVLSAFKKDHLGAFSEAWHQYLGSCELRVLERAFGEAQTTDEKRKLMERIQSILARSGKSQETILDETDISIFDIIMERANSDDQGILWPIDRLNDRVGPLTPGIVATVFGVPASGKSTLAQNTMYLNCHRRTKRGCYFYLEDTPARYKMNFVSRFSRDLADTSLRIQSQSMKRVADSKGIDFEVFANTVKKVEDLYEAEKKGTILYQSMHGFSNDPIVFGPQLARYCDKNEIDFLVVDHILRFGGFRHPDYPRNEYLNLMMGCLANVAIGQYGNKPLAVMPIAQPNREGEQRAIKTQGALTMYDVGEVSAVEKDSMILLGIHSDPAMRESQEVRTIILKSRDGQADSEPYPSFFDAPYNMIASNDSVSAEVVNSTELDDIFEFRTTVETRIAALAAERRDEGDLAAMDRALAAERAEQQRSSLFRADAGIHRSIAAAAHSPRLAAAMDAVRADLFLPVD